MRRVFYAETGEIMRKTVNNAFKIGSMTLALLLITPTLAHAKYNNMSASDNHKYYGWQLCKYHSDFSCEPVLSGQTWRSLWPDAWQREMIQRLNRMNIAMDSRPWIVVPKKLNKINYQQLSPFPNYRNTGGNRLILVNLTLQAFAAYNEKGHLIHWGPASGGKNYCPDIHRKCTTPTGSFAIQNKQGEECISHKYPIEKGGGAKMPYCMFFHGGFGLHGSGDLPGYNDSHGCIRLYVDDAKWLNLYFARIGTPVLISN